MANKRLLWAGLMLLAGLQAAQSLEITRGKIKLTVFERTGAFTVSYTDDIANSAFKPLFVSDDPTTSRTFVLVDEKSVILGSDPDFQLLTETSSTGVRMTWTGKNLRIIQALDFISSAQSPLVDGIQIKFTLQGYKTEQTVRTALKFLLDTNLGEKKDHFYLTTGEKIISESQFDAQNLPEAWISSLNQDSGGAGLLGGVYSGEGLKPSRLIFSNWRRLKESAWNFQVSNGRDFNLLPYSYNDSALQYVYDPIVLEPGQTKDIIIQIGAKSAGTWVGARLGSANTYSDLLDGTRKMSTQDLKDLMQKDKQSLEELLKKINASLDSGTTISDSDLAILQAVITELEQRKKAYQ